MPAVGAFIVGARIFFLSRPKQHGSARCGGRRPVHQRVEPNPGRGLCCRADCERGAAPNRSASPGRGGLQFPLYALVLNDCKVHLQDFESTEVLVVGRHYLQGFGNYLPVDPFGVLLPGLPHVLPRATPLKLQGEEVLWEVDVLCL